MADFFGNLGSGIRFPDARINGPGPLPTSLSGPAGINGDPDGRYNFNGNLLDGIGPYAGPDGGRMGSDRNYQQVPHRVQHIIPQVYLPSGTVDDQVAVSHAVDMGDLAFSVVSERLERLLVRNALVSGPRGPTPARNAFVNLPTVNYILAGLQRLDDRGPGPLPSNKRWQKNWKNLAYDLNYDPANTNRLAEVLRLVSTRLLPYGICAGSEHQGGKHETGLAPVQAAANHVTTMTVDGQNTDLVNYWRASTVSAGDVLILRLEPLETQSFGLNHYYKQMSSEAFADKVVCYQLVPDVFRANYNPLKGLNQKMDRKILTRNERAITDEDSYDPEEMRFDDDGPEFELARFDVERTQFRTNLVSELKIGASSIDPIYDYRFDGYWRIGQMFHHRNENTLQVKDYADDTCFLRGQLMKITFAPVWVQMEGRLPIKASHTWEGYPYSFLDRQNPALYNTGKQGAKKMPSFYGSGTTGTNRTPGTTEDKTKHDSDINIDVTQQTTPKKTEILTWIVDNMTEIYNLWKSTKKVIFELKDGTQIEDIRGQFGTPVAFYHSFVQTAIQQGLNEKQFVSFEITDIVETIYDDWYWYFVSIQQGIIPEKTNFNAYCKQMENHKKLDGDMELIRKCRKFNDNMMQIYYLIVMQKQAPKIMDDIINYVHGLIHSFMLLCYSFGSLIHNNVEQLKKLTIIGKSLTHENSVQKALEFYNVFDQIKTTFGDIDIQRATIKVTVSSTLDNFKTCLHMVQLWNDSRNKKVEINNGEIFKAFDWFRVNCAAVIRYYNLESDSGEIKMIKGYNKSLYSPLKCTMLIVSWQLAKKYDVTKIRAFTTDIINFEEWNGIYKILDSRQENMKFWCECAEFTILEIELVYMHRYDLTQLQYKDRKAVNALAERFLTYKHEISGKISEIISKKFESPVSDALKRVLDRLLKKFGDYSDGIYAEIDARNNEQKTKEGANKQNKTNNSENEALVNPDMVKQIDEVIKSYDKEHGDYKLYKYIRFQDIFTPQNSDNDNFYERLNQYGMEKHVPIFENNFFSESRSLVFCHEVLKWYTQYTRPSSNGVKGGFQITREYATTVNNLKMDRKLSQFVKRIHSSYEFLYVILKRVITNSACDKAMLNRTKGGEIPVSGSFYDLMVPFLTGVIYDSDWYIKNNGRVNFTDNAKKHIKSLAGDIVNFISDCQSAFDFVLEKEHYIEQFMVNIMHFVYDDFPQRPVKEQITALVNISSRIEESMPEIKDKVKSLPGVSESSFKYVQSIIILALECISDAIFILQTINKTATWNPDSNLEQTDITEIHDTGIETQELKDDLAGGKASDASQPVGLNRSDQAEGTTSTGNEETGVDIHAAGDGPGTRVCVLSNPMVVENGINEDKAAELNTVRQNANVVKIVKASSLKARAPASSGESKAKRAKTADKSGDKPDNKYVMDLS